MTPQTVQLTRPATVSTTGARAARLRRVSAGTLAGPTFLLLSALQLPLKDGFDLTRHAFSYLALGPYGALQQANFVLVGALFALNTVRLRQALSGRSRLLGTVLGVAMGAGMVVAGLFPVDPSFGFPPGAPAGRPDVVSLSGVLHGVGFGVSMLGWFGLLVVLGACLRRRGDRAWAAACFVLAVGLLLVPALSGASFGTVVLYVVVSVAFLFTSAVLRRIERTA